MSGRAEPFGRRSAVVYRARDWLKFQLERLLLRGTHVRLLVMAALVGLVSVVGGTFLMAIDAVETPAHAFWWAFLRLSDPGYLGDDEGVAKRVISTVVTVLGYVLFMGSLVAIMTQWLNETIRNLEQGMTRIFQKDHVLVCGWTSRTTTIAREMFEMQGRVERFLALHDARRLNLVLMVESLSAAVRDELRNDMGPLWREGQIVLRSGSSLHLDHLQRVDYLRAAAILLPSEDLGAYAGNEDARTIKTLMSITHAGANSDDPLPTVVTEIFDTRKVKIARRAYKGPLEIIASDQLVGRLLALCTLKPGMGHVFDELLAYGRGSEIHITEAPSLVGKTLGEVAAHFPRAVLLGTARRQKDTFGNDLCPSPDRVYGEGESLVVLADSHVDAAPSGEPTGMRRIASRVSTPPDKSYEPVKVLVVGWSDRVLDLAAELEDHHGGELTIDVLSALSVATRDEALADRPLARAVLRNFEGDTSRLSVVATRLDEGYDHVVVVASDYFASYSQSDARTIVAYLLIEEALRRRAQRPTVVVELMDAENLSLLEDREVDVVVSPLVIGRVLAHVAVRPELRSVYSELLDADGPSIGLVEPHLYDITDGEHRFRELTQAVEAYGDMLLGVLPDGPRHSLALNADKASRWTISDQSLLIVVGR